MENTNIEGFQQLIKPYVLKTQYPVPDNITHKIHLWREEIKNILSGHSTKKIFVVGPCSIHNIEEAIEYAKKLKVISDKVENNILIVMRVYFEKPRTSVGWKGLINDPYLNDTFAVNDGLQLARQLLLAINEIGLPCGYEVLDTITPQYICDLISWGAIGARTTESQVHRQMVSGLSMPVGFKNGTGGSKELARDAILSAKHKHCFMGITSEGEPAICKTLGNNNCHVILRGGSDGPNYYESDIDEMSKLLQDKDLNDSIMVDCSHGNSCKNHNNQKYVLHYVLNEIKNGKNIIGVMIESNLNAGNQKITNGHNGLLPGVSVTDSCIDIQETETILSAANTELTSIHLNICK